MTRQPPSHSPLTWIRQGLAMLALLILAACGGGQESGTAPQVSMRAQLDPVETPKSADMKLLVISATGEAPSFKAITSVLDQIGVPFDRLVLQGSNKTSLEMVPGTLSDGAGNGKYHGIILETGDLPYEKDPGYYPSAMTAAQWQMLWQYQRDFGVRTATLYTRPAITVSDDGQNLDLTYGLTPVSGRNTNNYTDTWVTSLADPVTATFTPEGSQVFNYLNSANPVSIVNAYTYFATPAVGANVTPLLQTNVESGGPYTIASVFTAPDGRQNLAITADSNKDLTHALLTGYGVVNWATKGLFLGQRKVYLSAQPDDFFIADTVWDAGSPDPACLNERETNPCPEYRMNATDYNRLVLWQNDLRSRPLTGDIRIEMPFNGYGYNLGFTGDPGNTLLAAVKANPGAFRWINHTWDHTSLDLVDPDDPENVPQSLAQMLNQFQLNDDLANARTDTGLSFSLYHKEAMVTPVYSGLENDTFWNAAQQFGFRHIVMDTSRTYDFRPTLAPIPTNTGFYSARDVFVPGNPRIFIIPRYPTSLFYNVTTPTEWVSEFNYLYGINDPYFDPPPGQDSWFGKDLNYAELLDFESDTLVRYMLRFNANSWMFHQSNLRAYGSTNASLLSDLLDAVTNKYRDMYKLPILSPSQVEIGQIMQARMAYNQAIAAGVKGRIVFDPTSNEMVRIELINPTGQPVPLPLTGSVYDGEAYGGQLITSLTVPAGGSISVPAPESWGAKLEADLGMAQAVSTSTPSVGGTLSFTLTITNAGRATVTNASFANNLPAGLGTITQVVSSVSGGATTSSINIGSTGINGLVSLPVGGQARVSFNASVSPTATPTLVNQATVTVPSDRFDPNPANNTAAQTLNVAFPDLTGTLQLPASAPAGSTVTGTVTVTNLGSATATAVVGTVTLSSGARFEITDFGTLAPSSAPVTRTVTVTVPTTGSTLTGTFTMATATLEWNKANNTVNATPALTILYADLTSTLALPASAPAGSVVSATLTVNNLGASTATAVIGTVTLPGGATSSLNFGDVAPTGTAQRSFNVTVPVTGAALTLTATVSTTAVESTTTNNGATSNALTLQYADVTTQITLPANAPASSVVNGTVVFTNSATGPSASTATAVSGSVSFSSGATTQTFSLGNLAPGISSAPQVFSFTMPASGSLVATSTVVTTAVESNSANNNASATSNALLPDLTASLTLPASAPAGSVVSATLTVNNLGDLAANDVTAIVTMPDGQTQSVYLGTIDADAQVTRLLDINVPVGVTSLSVGVTVSTATLESNTANDTSNATMDVTSTSVGSGGGGCTTNPDAAFDPMLLLLLLGGGLASVRRQRQARH